MNLNAKLKKIFERMKSIEDDERDIHFSDGSTIKKVTGRMIGDAISSVINNGEPNELAKTYLDKLSQGITDEEGNCYLISAYAIDSEGLWADEYE